MVFEGRKRVTLLAGFVFVNVVAIQPSLANGLGENVAWQFQTAAERANKAWIEEMRQKQANGAYAAPVYTTNIDRQFNCAVNSTATGNDSVGSMVGNSPSTSGNAPAALGNSNTSDFALGNGGAQGAVDNALDNSGRVTASASGEVESSVRGDTSQVLNNDQQNSGDQSAAVTGSNACQFGMLN